MFAIALAAKLAGVRGVVAIGELPANSEPRPLPPAAPRTTPARAARHRRNLRGQTPLASRLSVQTPRQSRLPALYRSSVQAHFWIGKDWTGLLGGREPEPGARPPNRRRLCAKVSRGGSVLHRDG